MDIKSFCEKHNACEEGAEWALSTGATTMQEIWDREDVKPEWRVWIATREGVLDNKTLRLFACWCVRRVWHLLTDERSRNAVEVAERFANGEATREELAAARAAAWNAAMAAAWNAAWNAAMAAAWNAAWNAAMAAAWNAQAKWLIENTKPKF